MGNAATPAMLWELHGPEPGLPCTPSPGTLPAEVLVPGMAKVNSAGAHGHSEGKL